MCKFCETESIEREPIISKRIKLASEEGVLVAGEIEPKESRIRFAVVFDYDSLEEEFISINYCPFCGRKLIGR